MRIVAFIPARSGSKRIPGKNTKLLGGKPLIQWTIDAANRSGVFDEVFVCSESDDVLSVCQDASWHWRAEETARDNAPDIWWVRDAVALAPRPDAFAILRPTSPFRTADTIRRAFERFKLEDCSSIRAMELVKQHPGKMWQEYAGEATPLIQNWRFADGTELRPAFAPWHSHPTQSLPKVYVQNSSLEMAWTWCVKVFDSISGPKVAPFFTEGWEGFSIDYPDDWERAERHAAELLAGVSAAPAAQ